MARQLTMKDRIAVALAGNKDSTNPFRDIAHEAAEALKQQAEGLQTGRSAKGTAWSVFQRAIPKAVELKMNPATFERDLSNACTAEGIKGSTQRVYIVTLRDMLAELNGERKAPNPSEVKTGNGADARILVPKDAPITAEQAVAIPLAKAQARYKAVEEVDPVVDAAIKRIEHAAASPARLALLATIVGWEEEQVEALNVYATAQAAKDQPQGDTEKQVAPKQARAA